MKITVSQLENVKELQTVSAESVYGTGLLTAFVSYFIEIFGAENRMLAKKIKKAKDRALNSIIDQARSFRDADGIMNLRFQLSNKAVLVYGTVYKKSENIISSTGAALYADELPEI